MWRMIDEVFIVITSFSHSLTHPGIHPAAKLSCGYRRTHAKNAAVLLKVMRISIVNRRMTNDLSCDFLGSFFPYFDFIESPIFFGVHRDFIIIRTQTDKQTDRHYNLMHPATNE